jgi:hypothetical protein
MYLRHGRILLLQVNYIITTNQRAGLKSTVTRWLRGWSGLVEKGNASCSHAERVYFIRAAFYREAPEQFVKMHRYTQDDHIFLDYCSPLVAWWGGRSPRLTLAQPPAGYATEPEHGRLNFGMC